MKKMISDGFNAASDAIRHDTDFHHDHNGMGTTMVAALVNEGLDCVIGYAGDSRAYLVGEQVQRVTTDHTFVQEMVQRGLISEEAALVHPERNVVTRIISAEPVAPDYAEIYLNNHTLLLCTDGFSEALGVPDIIHDSGCPKVEDVCKNLISRARQKNGDNATVVVARAGIPDA